MHALETINGYLEQTPLCCGGPKLASDRLAQSPNHRSIRERVLEQIREQARSVRDIETATGLTKRQVRGVISAPDLKDRIDRRTQDGIVEYRYIGDRKDEGED